MEMMVYGKLAIALELQVNEPLVPPAFPAFPGPDGVSIVDDIDRVKLQYELLE